ncbi:glycine--tRNA ligase [Clostridium tetani]|uniref:Glycine--tRNA ligase n=1 Tax=Clostridium tetani (strain Massachusetts / E88) TaxID=212717 RepID=SYG_CLOTE|nr:glycine--tRNA ligase [Clostridium tetani]Q899G6.1 RecName: Full=Glycine--tRNA ligase; AltName: Full=Glycyl-tRNA synthetase; Short=GlyRS [Clostridium tetani E88]AAO34860.1 glycyl-tRNA synthetase [Clostridium tetani E88]KGI38760.1 glycyl-tRNA ligase [Clostridium tetani ATCC 9441]KGI40709.1 glycyl-tRNA ligase [Clostridium tetani]KGI43546.1 glycyl-tRNA ligase [Clostridium tetani]KGI46418.1 glycyl-tRNA ligase [Clostridium tetani]
MTVEKTMDKIVALAKNRGFIFPGSEIYGGLANSWDYGPLGVEFKNNVKKAWWKKFVQESPYNVGIDAAILMNREVWVASGHVGGFSDPLMDCKECKARCRADKLIEDYMQDKDENFESADGWSNEQLKDFIDKNNIACPKCGEHNFTDVRKFNLMFKTFQGVTEDAQSEIFLRPETAQGIFVNFKNAIRTTRRKMPFGMAQIGKSFRNEITPGNFTFRTREFEQMELEFFCKPGTDLEWFEYWRDYSWNFLLSLGLAKDNLRIREHAKEELAFYSKATVDIEYLFPFGWGELWGIADRTDYDLKQHMNHSGKDLTYLDPETNEKYLPYCIEPSLGADRVALAFLVDAYDEEELDGGDSRTVLRLHPALAPFKAAILPLTKKLKDKSLEVYSMLSKYFNVDYDEAGTIGKRYRREDEIGTPYCITIDYDTLEDNTVTIRDRDSMDQIRINIDELVKYISEKVEF